MNKQLGTPIWASIVVYATGLAGLLLVQLITREPIPMAKLSAVPWWAWAGGVLSLISTIAAVVIAQRMGSSYFTGTAVTASLTVSLVIDNLVCWGLCIILHRRRGLRDVR